MYDVRLVSLTISYVIDVVTSVVDPSHIIAGTVLCMHRCACRGLP